MLLRNKVYSFQYFLFPVPSKQEIFFYFILLGESYKTLQMHTVHNGSDEYG